MSNDLRQAATQTFPTQSYAIEQAFKAGPVAGLLLCALLGLWAISESHVSRVMSAIEKKDAEMAKLAEKKDSDAKEDRKEFRQTLEACCRDKRLVQDNKANGFAGN